MCSDNPQNCRAITWTIHVLHRTLCTIPGTPMTVLRVGGAVSGPLWLTQHGMTATATLCSSEHPSVALDELFAALIARFGVVRSWWDFVVIQHGRIDRFVEVWTPHEMRPWVGRSKRVYLRLRDLGAVPAEAPAAPVEAGEQMEGDDLIPFTIRIEGSRQRFTVRAKKTFTEICSAIQRSPAWAQALTVEGVPNHPNIISCLSYLDRVSDIEYIYANATDCLDAVRSYGGVPAVLYVKTVRAG